MPQDDGETTNVKKKEHKGGMTEDVYVFEFFEDTEKVYNFKKFLTPVGEKNMVIYLNIKS